MSCRGPDDDAREAQFEAMQESYEADSARCLRAAEAFATWHDALKFALEKGWARDEADFDSKIQYAEEGLGS